MRFERGVEKAEFSDQEVFPPSGHRFDFDRAFWMSELEPADPLNGVARVDARSLAIPASAPRTSAEQGAGASPDPYVFTGQGWVTGRTAAGARNTLTADLTGASAVRFDLRRMGIDPKRVVTAVVDASAPLELRLTGRWPGRPVVRVDGRRSRFAKGPDGIAVRLGPGRRELTIRPARR
jgi:hypothetical protein